MNAFARKMDMKKASDGQQTRDHDRADVIDEALIERVVRRFYDQARRDDMLGPVFSAHV